MTEDANDLFVLDDFDLEEILHDLSSVGATSVEILREDFRMVLLTEAGGYAYESEPEVVGSGEEAVRQEMGSFEAFPEDSQFIRLRDAYQALLEAHLAGLHEYPFATPLDLNAMVLQKYEPGSLGITPHRDGFKYKNLVNVFVIGGRGKFFVCADRSGRDAHEVDASPGRVVVLRAPGFEGSQERPFHYVTDIPGIRYTFGLRQRRRRA